MARTKLKDYLNAKQFEHGHDPEDVAQLNEFEQKIVHKHLLMTIQGKRGRRVSVLIKRELIEEALDVLVENRHQFVSEGNEYLIANSGDSYIKPWNLLKKAAITCNCDFPDTIKSTCLRRHAATSVQVLNLEENELDQFANFMVSHCVLNQTCSNWIKLVQT